MLLRPLISLEPCMLGLSLFYKMVEIPFRLLLMLHRIIILQQQNYLYKILDINKMECNFWLFKSQENGSFLVIHKQLHCQAAVTIVITYMYPKYLDPFASLNFKQTCFDYLAMVEWQIVKTVIKLLH